MPGTRAGGGGSDQLRRFRRLSDLTVLATFALIVLGGIVRVSESGLGCGPGGSGTEGWPLCNGEAIPFFHNTEVIVEFSHRTLAAIVTALIALLAWTAYRHLREMRWPLRLTVAAGVLVLVQAALGGLTVEKSLAEELVAAHLGLAMILIGLMLWISVRARVELAAAEPGAAKAGSPVRPPVRGLKPFTVAAAVLLLCAIVAGGYVAGTEEEGIHGSGANVAGAHMACGEQFPGCLNQGVAPFGESRLSDIHLTHRMFVYGATLAILLLLGVAFRRGARSPLMAVGLALLASQVLLGALNVLLEEHAALIVAHLVIATLLWSTVLLIGFTLAFSPAPVSARSAARAPATSTAAAEA
jgi:heme A synthase